MTLLELTEPLFQYICRLNRVARKAGGPGASGDTTTFTKAGAAPRGASLDYAVVRGEIKAFLDEMQQKSAKDYRLNAQLKKIELPLCFFVDSLISESGLGFAAKWNQNRLAYEQNELAGDEKFFDLLEEDMKDQSDEASERRGVFYLCLGLGFSGIYFKQPEFLRKTMFSIAPRIKRWIDTDEAARICPDAYENVDTRDLTEPPSHKVLILSLVFVSLIIAALATYFFLYHQYKQNLNASLKEVIEHHDLSRAK
jgi:type IV/VI secretion system ImpK/VasF family protein